MKQLNKQKTKITKDENQDTKEKHLTQDMPTPKRVVNRKGNMKRSEVLE
jgi:hypothetical protein